MKIAVLSGKGGTGKTLVSVNLAAVSETSIYMDCDVEEPNGHLFFKPQNIISQDVLVKMPFVNNDLCTGCRKCVDFCKFNALAYIQNKLMIFEDVCHSCGGCQLVCPENALHEKDKKIGEIHIGDSEQVRVMSGILNTGEASGVPIIKSLTAYLEDEEVETFIDCPPGSACIVMESIKEADYCILVAEPTIFGVHNLNMVFELVRLFGKPYGAILNKCTDAENPAKNYCIANHIPILSEIPYEQVLGTLNSNARIASREDKDYRSLFRSILEKVRMEVRNETITHS